MGNLLCLHTLVDIGEWIDQFLLTPVLANLFMEEFEVTAITEAPPKKMFWGRYVGDIVVVNKKEYEDELFQHINQQHNSIKFTIEQGVDNSLLMLDIRMIRENSSITTNIYRKATHIDQCLEWTSNCSVHQELGMGISPMHHTETLINDEGRMKTEKEK